MKRQTIFDIGMVAVIALIILFVSAVPHGVSKIKQLNNLPDWYVVSSEKHHREVYLLFTTQDGGHPADIPDWSIMLEQAWRFDTWDDAYFQARRVGGAVLAVKEGVK